MREHHVCREKRTLRCLVEVFAVGSLWLSCWKSVPCFWDLVGLLEMYVLNSSCLAKATESWKVSALSHRALWWEGNSTIYFPLPIPYRCICCCLNAQKETGITNWSCGFSLCIHCCSSLLFSSTWRKLNQSHRSDMMIFNVQTTANKKIIQATL